MNLSANTFTGQVILEIVALLCPDHKEMPNRDRPFGHRGQHQVADARQLGEIARRQVSAPVVPLGQMREFNPKESSLKLVEPGIQADKFVLVSLARTIITEIT